jgi:hypothetical protein
VLLGVAVIGAFLVAVEPGRRTAAGAPEAVLAAFAYAGVLIALGQSNLPDLTTVGVTRTVSVLAILPAFLLVRELPKRTNVYPILWCGLLDAVGFTFFAFAASIGPLSVASVTATQWGTAAALIGIEALVRGGTLDIAAELRTDGPRPSSEIVIRASGARVVFDRYVGLALVVMLPPEDLSSRTAPDAMLRQLVDGLGGTLQYHATPEALVMGAMLPVSA